jgi:hypothetical protein
MRADDIKAESAQPARAFASSSSTNRARSLQGHRDRDEARQEQEHQVDLATALGETPPDVSKRR